MLKKIFFTCSNFFFFFFYKNISRQFLLLCRKKKCKGKNFPLGGHYVMFRMMNFRVWRGGREGELHGPGIICTGITGITGGGIICTGIIWLRQGKFWCARKWTSIYLGATDWKNKGIKRWEGSNENKGIKFPLYRP